MRRSNRWGLALAATVLIATVAGVQPGAQASTATGSDDPTALSALEQRVAAQVPGLKAQLGDAFGGAWFDSSGTLHVGVVGAVARSAPAGVRYESVARPAAELDALAERIGADVAAGSLADLGASGVGVSAPAQSVVVAVTGDAATATSALRARYGDAVSATTTAAPKLAERDCLNPLEATLHPGGCDPTQKLRAALQITSNQNVACSTSFGTHVGAQAYVVTAGHCQVASEGAVWGIGGGSGFGNSSRKTFTDGSTADSLAITVPQIRTPSTDCVYETEGRCRQVAGYGSYLVAGQTVCKSGYRTEVSCGQVLFPEYSVLYAAEGVTINRVAVACSTVNSGDSGGAVYSVTSSGSAIAQGILSGSTAATSCPPVPLPNLDGADNIMFFTPWRNALSPTVGFPMRSGYREATDFSGDACADVLGQQPNGDLYMYKGGCAGQFVAAGRFVGDGWHTIDTLMRTPDFDGDGCSDVIGRAGTQLFFYPGSCGGGFVGSRTLIGEGWNIFSSMLAPGDWSGDGCPDVLGLSPEGNLWLYPGDCAGDFAAPGRIIGTGWNIFDKVLAPGDLSGDGCPDLVGVYSDGRLMLYKGNCTGDFQQDISQIGAGWNAFDAIVTPGDFSGDGCTDLMGRLPDGTLLEFNGTCAGGFTAGGVIGTGWNMFTRIQ